MAGGRPQKFKTPRKMQNAIDKYFESEKRPTVSGLAFALGFESRQSFYDYEKNKEFSYTIKRARLLMEIYYEQKLTDSDASPSGAIFALKNFGWSDKKEIDLMAKVDFENETLKEIQAELMNGD